MKTRAGRAALVALVAGLVALAVAGCATITVRGEETADTKRVADALSELPKDGVWERLACWAGMHVVPSPRVSTVGIAVCTIYVNPRFLGVPHEVMRAALAHEMGHVYNNDAGIGRRTEALRVEARIEQERQADAVAVRLLSRISLEACLALPRFLASFDQEESQSHPASMARAQDTYAWCHQAAEKPR